MVARFGSCSAQSYTLIRPCNDSVKYGMMRSLFNPVCAAHEQSILVLMAASQKVQPFQCCFLPQHECSMFDGECAMRRSRFNSVCLPQHELAMF